MQFKAAEGGNATMLIWLGKQYLGQSDKTQQEISGPEGKPVQVQVDLSPLSEEELRVLESITKRLEFRTVQFLFLPTEADRLRACLKQASEALGADEVVAMRLDDFDRAVSDLAKAQMSYNVQNSALGMMLVLDVFERHQTDLALGWQDSQGKNRSRVPISSIFGEDVLPVDTARTVKRAVDRMVARGEVDAAELWRCIEKWAAGYLGGE